MMNLCLTSKILSKHNNIHNNDMKYAMKSSNNNELTRKMHIINACKLFSFVYTRGRRRRGKREKREGDGDVDCRCGERREAHTKR